METEHGFDASKVRWRFKNTDLFVLKGRGGNESAIRREESPQKDDGEIPESRGKEEEEEEHDARNHLGKSNENVETTISLEELVGVVDEKEKNEVYSEALIERRKNEEEAEQEENDEDEKLSDSSSVAYSLEEVQSLPLLRLDMDRVTGGQGPRTWDEYHQVCCNLYRVLHCGDEEPLAVDFVSDSAELFDAGMATHADTRMKCEAVFSPNQIDGHGKTEQPAERQDILDSVLMRYPDYIVLQDRLGSEVRPKKDSTDNDDMCAAKDCGTKQTVKRTEEVWNGVVLRSHKIPVVHRVLRHLAVCNRDLGWKHDMALELRHVARAEDSRRAERRRRAELRLWRTELRPAELDKLFTVRETFSNQLERARENVEELAAERNLRVKKKLRQRQQAGIGSGGVDHLDWDGTTSFAMTDTPMEQLSVVHQKGNDDEGDEYAFQDRYHDEDADDQEENGEDDDEDDEDDEFADDEQGDDQEQALDIDERDEAADLVIAGRNGKEDETANEGNATTNTTAATSEELLAAKHPCRRRRRPKTSKIWRNKLESQKEAARAQAQQTKLDEAHQEEAFVQEECMTAEERTSQAIVTSLETQLERVETLLEELQEQEWADEEAGLIDEDEDEDQEEEVDLDNQDRPLTLLDQVLAMILGSLSPEHAIGMEEHYAYVKEEHRIVLEEWKKYFGRLPPAAVSTTSKRNVADEAESNAAISDVDAIWEQGGEPNVLKYTDNHEAPKETKTSADAGISADHWEDDDWDDYLDDLFPRPATKEEEATPPVKPKKSGGLRPGGRVGTR